MIEELSEKVPNIKDTLDSSLDWFIGKGIDNETMDALTEEDRLQKEKIAKTNALS